MGRGQTELTYLLVQNPEMRREREIERLLTFLGFLVCLSQSGSVERQMALMAYLEHSLLRSGDAVITCSAACSFCSM